MATSSLNVIALISGGKDSFFSLLHCLANNHAVIALANLCPPPPSPNSPPSDLNSYMYQTVGHKLIPHYSTTLGLPLYRAFISGNAFNTLKDYSNPSPSFAQENVVTERVQDETESLVPLLKTILAAHPTANAICTGAILSTYQRTRIENVARRFNLIPLSYLWQYPSLPCPLSEPTALLQDMAAVGMEARIVKVASGGLDERILWENPLMDKGRRMVKRGVGRFGGSVLGEGGEYETLLLNGPNGVWKGRIVVDEEERIIRRASGGEAWIDVSGGRVVEKEETGEGLEGWREKLRIPDLYDAVFEKLEGDAAVPGEVMQRYYRNRCAESQGQNWTITRSLVQGKLRLVISNIASASAEGNIENQISSITSTILTLLQPYQRSADDIIFTTVLLRTMSDFPRMNDIYGTLFTAPNPPARVTVACGDALPQGVDVLLFIIVDLGTRQNRRGLHVQSRSYWAPANIGPYSQAISVYAGQDTSNPSLVYVAGQIPLVPASMELLRAKGDNNGVDTKSFRQRGILALQHLWRIGVEMGVSWWTGAIAFVVGDHDAPEKAVTAWMLWEKLHEVPKAEDSEEEDPDDGPDVWDRRYGIHQAYCSTDEPPKNPLPAFHSVDSDGKTCDSLVPGFFAVQVDDLPRGCDIEWQSLGIAHGRVKIQSCDMGESLGIECSVSGGHTAVAYYGIPDLACNVQCQQLVTRIMQRHRTGCSEGGTLEADAFLHTVVYTPRPVCFEDFPVQIVPCRKVWGPNGKLLVAGLVIHSGI